MVLLCCIYGERGRGENDPMPTSGVIVVDFVFGGTLLFMHEDGDADSDGGEKEVGYDW